MTLPPTKPKLTFQVCNDDYADYLCLSTENARKLALWLLQMERWAAETTSLCSGDN